MIKKIKIRYIVISMVCILIILAGVLFLLLKQMQNKKKLWSLPPITTLSSQSNKFRCGEHITSYTIGQNNPEKKSLISDISYPEEDVFELITYGSQLRITGKLSGYTEGFIYGTVIDNNNEILFGYFTNEHSLGKEYFTVFIVKDSGHGILQRSEYKQYVNKQVGNFATYITCTAVDEMQN